MDVEFKDLTLFDNLGKKPDVPMEVSTLAVVIIRNCLDRYGPWAWSPMVVKRCEDDGCAVLNKPANSMPRHYLFLRNLRDDEQIA